MIEHSNVGKKNLYIVAIKYSRNIVKYNYLSLSKKIV